jgi:hypothetical protein
MDLENAPSIVLPIAILMAVLAGVPRPRLT